MIRIGFGLALVIGFAVPLSLVGSRRSSAAVAAESWCSQHPVANVSMIDRARKNRLGLNSQYLLERVNQEPINTGGSACPDPTRWASVGAITYYGSQHCSGVLISPNVVLTAAHCIFKFDYNAMQFQIGPDGAKPNRRVPVVDADLPDDYDETHLGLNDIGVLFLAESITDVRLFPLSQQQVPKAVAHGAQFLFVGYGAAQSNIPGFQRCLTLPIIRGCKDSFEYAESEKGRSLCNGDSGGPSLRRMDGGFALAGITSWGDKDCRDHGVSTDVAHYRPWIAEKILDGQQLQSPVDAGVVHAPAPAWPSFPPNKLFEVTRADAQMRIPLLRIPDGATIRLAPDVVSVDWLVDEMEFGKNATIDLSASQDSPSPPPDASSTQGQPPWGVAGVNGSNGAPGLQGLGGKRLSLIVRNRPKKTGALWIKTDGGPGQTGGRGAKGQLGGGTSCGKCGLFGPNEPHTNGGAGGDGGNGGPGGAGGDTAFVQTNLPITALHHCEDSCGPSTRPALALGDDGAIVVLGSPGCAGKGGPSGEHGEGAGPPRHCPCGPDVSVGPMGHDGVPGLNGPRGSCSPVTVSDQ